jgi:hypothetical protein
MAASPEPKSIIPMFLESPPDTVSAYQGIGLKIPRDLLLLTAEQFKARNDVDAEDPMCLLIQKLQDRVDSYTEAAGLKKPRLRPTPLECFAAMRLDIFEYLKTTIDEVIKPQKQVTVKSTTAALADIDAGLPGDARIIPVGTGSPMSIFGLPDEEISWDDFTHAISGRQKDSWRQAIANVVNSSVRGINVDNSQVILSKDESTSYRLIMTTATRYFDGTQEFSLYFVETLYRQEYGDANTTMLLKGLELVCRYRFMFLEQDSKFTSNNILITRPDRLIDIASELLRELNLIRRDSLNAGLDEPTVWSKFIDWSVLLEVAKTFEPVEADMRQLISRIFRAGDKTEQLVGLRRDLADKLSQLAGATLSPNSQLIDSMAQKLQSLVHRPDLAGNRI